jgi:hypothetical protein
MKVFWWALGGAAAVVTALWAGDDIGHGGAVTVLITAGLLALALISALVIVSHKTQAWVPPAIEAPKRLALPAPAEPDDSWLVRSTFTLARIEPDPEEILELTEDGDPCEGPGCPNALPERPWTAGGTLEDGSHQFCSEGCQKSWIEAGLWRPAARRGRH